MQSVSQKWKDNQNAKLVSESFVEISLDLTDPSATADASATDNGSAPFSNTEQIVGTSETDIISYATLEQNLWLLDGKKEIIGDSYTSGETGYVSDILCDENGIFPLSPTITINFSKVHEEFISGVGITWSTSENDYPTDFTVTAYNGDTVVDEKVISDNTKITTLVLFDIVNYDRITISINKWCLPYRRARLEDILLGVKKTYTKSDLFSFSHSQEVDPISATLPKGTVSFEVNNLGREYDINNIEGLAKYLTERQEIKVRYGYKVEDDTEWIDGGVYYLSGWESKENNNSARFEANLIFEDLSAIYNQGVYSEEGRSLYDLAIDVLTFANIPLAADGNVRWVIDESLKDITTVAVLPLDTVANCLQLIANAGCCVLYQDRKGIIHIEKKQYVPDDYSIHSGNSFSKPETTLSKPIKSIKVSAYSYEVGAEKTLCNFGLVFPWKKEDVWEFTGKYTVNGEECLATDCRITNTPSVDVAYTIPKQVFYARYAEIQILRIPDAPTMGFALKISGKPLETFSREITVLVGEVGEEIQIDNPLITSEEHARLVAEWVKDTLMKRQTVKFSWRADPRLDAGDIVENQDTYNTNTVLMTKVDYAYNGAFKGSGEGRVI